METSSALWTPANNKAWIAAAQFLILPCLVGSGLAQILISKDVVWLSAGGWFWPIASLVVSLGFLLKRAITPFEDRTTAIAAWLALTWTWFYVPLWLLATPVPRTSAVVNRHASVFVASEATRFTDERIWLLTGRAGKKIVANVEGNATIHGVEVRYRFSDAFIATRGNDEDLARPVLSAVAQALSTESLKPRSVRIGLFEKPEVNAGMAAKICREITHDSKACPLKLTLAPRSEATTIGAVWSKQFSEKEAIAERHLPTLIHFLTQDNVRLVERDRIEALFMEIVEAVSDLSFVARRSRVLGEPQFDELIRRILASPAGGNEAVSILAELNRLDPEQRQALRNKALGEASPAVLLKPNSPIRLSDADIDLLARRMPGAFERNAEVAVKALEVLGERLPPETQQHAVSAIVVGKAAHALGALRHVTFAPALRQELLKKVLADADVADFDQAQLGTGKLRDILTTSELRALAAAVVRKSERLPQWRDFAVRALPVRSMTTEERKSLLNSMIFKSAKSALEFASENREYLDPADVSEITTDYTRTITRDLCLHLSHRNANRGTEYFSDAQLQIFRQCAGAK